MVFGLVGAGGMGRALMAFLPDGLQVPVGKRLERMTFVESQPPVGGVNGIDCVSFEQFLAMSGDLAFNVSVSDSVTRKRLADRIEQAGASLVSIIHPNAQVGPSSEVGVGAVLCAFSTITANVVIGKMFQCNLYSYVEHDSVVGDYVTFAPGVHCNGNVHVGDHAYIGSGAVLRNGTPDKPLVVGEGAVVGMGAVVVKDVPAFTTVVGNPARPLVP